MSVKDDLYALAKLRRSRPNLERITDQLADLEEMAESADNFRESLAEVKQAMETFSEVLDRTEDDHPALNWVAEIREAVGAFLNVLPEEDSEPLADLISEAQDAAEEYGNSLDDKDYSREDREEMWDNLLGSLENIAAAMVLCQPGQG